MNLKKEFEEMKKEYRYPGYLLTNDRKKIIVYSPFKEKEPLGVFNIKYFKRIYNKVFNAWAQRKNEIPTLEEAEKFIKEYYN